MSIPSEVLTNEFDEQKVQNPIVNCPSKSKWSAVVSLNASNPVLPTCLPSLTVKQKTKEVKHPTKAAIKSKPPSLNEIVKDRSKVIILLRGLPGCGKTSFAKFLKSQSSSEDQVSIYSVNSFFENKDGKYSFDGRRVREAKKASFSAVGKLMKDATPVIIVDDCNITIADVKPYVAEAELNSYDVEIVEVKTPWCKNIDELVSRCVRNGHEVSKDVIESMDQRWYHDMTIDNIKKFTQNTSTKHNRNRRNK